MIDEYWTWVFYGYHSDDLKPQSNKPIVAVCEECCKYRILEMKGYHDLCKSCGRSGRRNWNFGKPMLATTKKALLESHIGSHPTEDTRLKMSISGKNRPPITEETRNKMRRSSAGENNPNWKGGISPWRNTVARMPAYKNWRKDVFERDDYTCQICNVRGGKLEAHHILPVRDNKNTLLIFDIDNGITLCKKCHQHIGGKELDYVRDFKRIIIGDDYNEHDNI